MVDSRQAWDDVPNHAVAHVVTAMGAHELWWRLNDRGKILARMSPWDPSYGSSRPSTAVVLALDVRADWSAWQFKRAALDGAKVAGVADELAQDGGPFAPGSWPQV